MLRAALISPLYFTQFQNILLAPKTLAVPTCDGRLDVDHGLLGAEDGGAVVDDAQRRGLVYAALQDEVLFEHVGPWLAGARVEHLGRRQLVTRRERARVRPNRSLHSVAGKGLCSKRELRNINFAMRRLTREKQVCLQIISRNCAQDGIPSAGERELQRDMEPGLSEERVRCSYRLFTRIARAGWDRVRACRLRHWTKVRAQSPLDYVKQKQRRGEVSGDHVTYVSPAADTAQTSPTSSRHSRAARNNRAHGAIRECFLPYTAGSLHTPRLYFCWVRKGTGETRGDGYESILGRIQQVRYIKSGHCYVTQRTSQWELYGGHPLLGGCVSGFADYAGNQHGVTGRTLEQWASLQIEDAAVKIAAASRVVGSAEQPTIFTIAGREMGTRRGGGTSGAQRHVSDSLPSFLRLQAHYSWAYVSSTARSSESEQVAQGRGIGEGMIRNRPWPFKDPSQHSPQGGRHVTKSQDPAHVTPPTSWHCSFSWPVRRRPTHNCSTPLLRRQRESSLLYAVSTITTLTDRGGGGGTTRLPQGRTGFNPRPGHPGFSNVGIVPDDAAGRRIFSGIPPTPTAPSFRRCSTTQSSSSVLKISLLGAA
ncbi:hypothetical protein PR048_029190 [Dryococelus australis]|uniref:Uncharacterized protein n=1 Tax=Dryococelus australis TaxID=614101 RepID=A0ABQ9GF76_9NEOP|nr:hypothetical protein PR048_029190 [Dryococelus australis]